MRAACSPDSRGLQIGDVVGAHQPVKTLPIFALFLGKTQNGQYAFSLGVFSLLLITSNQSFVFLHDCCDRDC